jgi:hypothetical protein
MIRKDMNACRQSYDYGTDESGCILHTTINCLLCAAIGHRWPGIEMTSGLSDYDLTIWARVWFDVEKCGLLFKTRLCNLLKFKTAA